LKNFVLLNRRSFIGNVSGSFESGFQNRLDFFSQCFLVNCGFDSLKSFELEELMRSEAVRAILEGVLEGADILLEEKTKIFRQANI